MNLDEFRWFDPLEWFVSSGLDRKAMENYEYLHGIYGPLDAYACLKIRDSMRDKACFGRGVPTDVFILSLEESCDRAQSKIGGLPFLKRGRPWPTNSEGQPIPFLAQFNFVRSRDICAQAASDVLLLFSHNDPILGCQALWESMSDSADLISAEELPVASEVTELCGIPWRTVNHPDWRLKHDNMGASSVVLGSGRRIYNIFFLFEILGMQIGRGGFMSSGTVGVSIRNDESLICSLSGISVRAGCPFPFLNRAEPFDEDSARKLLFPLSNIKDDDGFGIIFVLQDSNGKLRCCHKNL